MLRAFYEPSRAFYEQCCRANPALVLPGATPIMIQSAKPYRPTSARLPCSCLAITLALLFAGCAPSFPAVHLNQVGYVPGARKVAVVTTESSAPVPFLVTDAVGRSVLTGETTPRGEDPTSGERLHWADLSALAHHGNGYRLQVGEEVSFPFDVGPAIYRKLKYDALRYFYYNRSGIPIILPFAVDFKWTRPPGHLSDAKVACIGKSCGYRLDVSGGWYDAGDHGKYVVNGGLSVWTLLNLYERTLHLGSSIDDFGDGKLVIPESGNGTSDLLDEARWEIEFILRMQVPEGHEKSGMAHHKVHDTYWTTLGTTPPTETASRFLHTPSTAATLNLVAVGAQCARIFERIDPAFAERCLLAAKRGWNAAERFPTLFASPLDREGGGPYDDKEVSDEFYWAAAELYATLRLPALLEYLRASEHFLRVAPEVGHERDREFTAWTWQSTASLGTVSLAIVPGVLSEADGAAARRAIVDAADVYAAEVENQGYRVPFRPSTEGKFPWGSNSFIANNAMVLGLAHDFTNEPRYLQGIVEALDYLLGKNPNGISYVTGYGEYAFENPHHRHWAHMRSPRIPRPPPGALAGGPNSSLQDPLAKRRRSGCAPMACYVDHVDAWSVNEVAINWNAPLSWIAAFVDEKSRVASSWGE